jgi:hypothetical protein
MVFLLLPLIFLIHKPVITESMGIGSLLRRDKMEEGEFILKIIVMPDTGQLW